MKYAKVKEKNTMKHLQTDPGNFHRKIPVNEEVLNSPTVTVRNLEEITEKVNKAFAFSDRCSGVDYRLLNRPMVSPNVDKI